MILWNNSTVTVRYQSSTDRLTKNGQVWGGSKGVYYDRLPSYLRSQFPIKGTRDVDTSDKNQLYLPTRTLVYMLRSDDWPTVNLTTWTETNEKGNFLGPVAGTIRIYKQEFEAGYHILDNKGAMFLFVDAGDNGIYKSSICSLK